MKTSVALVKSSRSLSTGWISSKLCEFTTYGRDLGGRCKARFPGTFLQMGTKCGATLISLCHSLIDATGCRG